MCATAAHLAEYGRPLRVGEVGLAEPGSEDVMVGKVVPDARA